MHEDWTVSLSSECTLYQYPHALSQLGQVRTFKPYGLRALLIVHLGSSDAKITTSIVEYLDLSFIVSSVSCRVG